MPVNIKNKFKKNARPRVLNKTFDDFRRDLLNYAGTNFSNEIKDFSENSLGGMFLDFAAIVGESMSFYLDQQFDELNYETSNNPNNIQRHLRQAGITTNSPTPSIVDLDVYIEVDALNGEMTPDPTNVPVLRKFSEFSSSDNINFILQEDIDFSESPEILVGEREDDGTISTLILKKKGICTSGNISDETFSFPASIRNTFLSYTIVNPDVTKIVSLIDNDFNTYYEVESLSQDTVYSKEENDFNTFYKLIYASHRFVREDDLVNNITRIRFGNGKNESLKDDILSNPEDISLPILGRDYDSNFSLDPKKLLNTNTLGISPQGKTLTIKYFHGGGINHNVEEDSINTVERLLIDFPNTPTTDVGDEIIIAVTESLSVNNEEKAVGGSNKSSLTNLVQFIPSFKKMQNRIINHEDLISRVYTMPSNFGRVSKASIIENPFSNITKNLYIVCRDSDGFYENASDSLKINLKNYLNNFRLLGDAYNIVDAPIYNIGLNLVIKVKQGFESESTLNQVYFEIINSMRLKDLDIGEAINVNDIIYIALGNEGVASVISQQKDIVILKSNENNFFSDDLDENIQYSRNKFSVYDNFENGILYPPTGGIFELKYEDFDITIRNG